MLLEFKCAEGFAPDTPDAPLPVSPRVRGAGARLIAELIALAGGHGTLVEHQQRAWASVTFSGARHELAMRFEGDEALAAGEMLIAALPDHEFTIPRKLVADAAVIAVNHTLVPKSVLDVRCEVLILDED